MDSDRQDDQGIAQEQRFASGAGCGWTPLDKSESYYCRCNGRAFRVARGQDKRWTLSRIKDVSDDGQSLGVYLGRCEASDALKKIAYSPE